MSLGKTPYDRLSQQYIDRVMPFLHFAMAIFGAELTNSSYCANSFASTWDYAITISGTSMESLVYWTILMIMKCQTLIVWVVLMPWWKVDHYKKNGLLWRARSAAKGTFDL